MTTIPIGHGMVIASHMDRQATFLNPSFLQLVQWAYDTQKAKEASDTLFTHEVHT